MTHETTPSHPVPTPSRFPGRPQKSTSSQSVPPYGDEVELASNTDDLKTHHPVPNNGTGSTTTPGATMTTTTPTPKHPDCTTCATYLDHRGDTLAPEIVKTARTRGIPTRPLVVAYIDAVHERHLAGLSLEVPAP